MIIVPDYSAMVSGMVHQLLEKGGDVVIGNKTLALIERSKRDGTTDGRVGMAELQNLRKLAAEKKISA